MKKPKYTLDPNRAISWSQKSSFDWDPEQWFESTILGKRQTSREMTFGSEIDKRFQEDPTFLPELPRYGMLQHKMEAKLSKFKIVGVPDDLSLGADPKLFDLKTGKKAWDQARAEATGQLKMYLLLVWLNYKIPPEKFTCGIHWLPTYERGDFSIALIEPIVPQTFYVNITMRDVLEFGVDLEKTVVKMKAYAEGHA